MPPVMERPGDTGGDENRPSDDRVLGHSIQVQNRDAAQDKPHRDDPVDVGKQPEVPEQPRTANDDQSNGQTGISHESSPPTLTAVKPVVTTSDARRSTAVILVKVDRKST